MSSILSSQVRVGLRVRPVSIKEHGSDNVVHVDGHSVALLGRRFTYDHVFDPSTTQSALYEQVSPQLLQSFLEGYNATVRLKLCWLSLLIQYLHQKISPISDHIPTPLVEY